MAQVVLTHEQRQQLRGATDKQRGGAAKKKRGAYRKGCGWCQERTHSSCRLLGDPKGQWMHVSGFTSHNKKHHMPAEQQLDYKLFVQEDDAQYIEGCARCAEGFWQKQDLDRHVLVRLHSTHNVAVLQSYCCVALHHCYILPAV